MVTTNIILIGLSRFTYILVDKYFDREGDFLGFKWLSTAFWNTGVELFTINIGLFMYYGTFFMEQSVRPMFRMVSFVLVAIGCFFMSWILFDDTGITNSLELVFSAATGLFSAHIAISMYRYLVRYMDGLKFSIKELIKVMVTVMPTYIGDKSEIEVYEEEVVWPTLNKVNDAT
jgi:hypothetical protein